MEKVSSTDAKNPIDAAPRRFDELPNLVVPDDFDDALPDDETAAWDTEST